MRLIWIFCSIALIALIVIRVPTRDSSETQTTSVALGVSNSTQSPLNFLDIALWGLAVSFLLLSVSMAQS